MLLDLRNFKNKNEKFDDYSNKNCKNSIFGGTQLLKESFLKQIIKRSRLKPSYPGFYKNKERKKKFLHILDS